MLTIVAVPGEQILLTVAAEQLAGSAALVTGSAEYQDVLARKKLACAQVLGEVRSW